MKKISKKLTLIYISICFLLALFVDKCDVNAKGIMEEKNFLQITGYEVSNETIILGKEFDLSVYITNYSNTIAANNVIVSIANPEGVIPEYGTVSIKRIESIQPGTTEKVTFSYSANSAIKNTEVNFNVSVAANETACAAQLRIKVGKKTEFDVKDYYLPNEFTVGKTEVLSAYIENIGLSTVNNVVMKAKIGGLEVGSVNIGTMSAGTTKTEYINLCLLQEGEYSVDLVLEYTIIDGTEKEYIIASKKVKVVEPKDDSEDQGADKESDIDNPSVGGNEETTNIVIICISGILLIAVCCAILLLVYRRK